MVTLAESLLPIDIAAEHFGLRCAVVGGVVRDWLRDDLDQVKDLDLIIEGNAVDFANYLSPLFKGTVKVFPDFRTAKIILPANASEGLTEIDLASARTETYPKPGALPVVQWATIQDDLSRRDFTINAVAIEITKFISLVPINPTAEAIGVCIDPTGGIQAIAEKSIAIIHPKSFVDDPTRIFRAVRYSARIGFSLAPDTKAAMTDAINNQALSTISIKRIFNELQKILEESTWQQALALLFQAGLQTAHNIDLTITNEVAQQLTATDATQRYLQFIKSICAKLTSFQAKQLLQDLGLTKAQKNIIGIS